MTNLKVFQPAFISALTLLLCHVAMAEPLPTKSRPAQAKPTKVAASYRLMLSLGKNWNISQTGVPVVTTFANPGLYTLIYDYTRDPFSFHVEYQAARTDAVVETNWVTLVPFPSPYVGRSLKILAMDDIETLFAGQHWSKQTYTPQFSTTAEGLYRITARIEFPEASQFEGSADNSKNYRKVVINLYSNSVMIRCAANRLIPIDPATGKETASK